MESPVVLIATALVIAALVAMVLSYSRAKPKAEAITSEALNRTAVGAVTEMLHLRASKQAAIADLQAQIQADDTRIALVKQSIASLTMTTPAVEPSAPA